MVRVKVGETIIVKTLTRQLRQLTTAAARNSRHKITLSGLSACNVDIRTLV